MHTRSPAAPRPYQHAHDSLASVRAGRSLPVARRGGAAARAEWRREGPPVNGRVMCAWWGRSPRPPLRIPGSCGAGRRAVPAGTPAVSSPPPAVVSVAPAWAARAGVRRAGPGAWASGGGAGVSRRYRPAARRAGAGGRVRRLAGEVHGSGSRRRRLRQPDGVLPSEAAAQAVPPAGVPVVAELIVASPSPGCPRTRTPRGSSRCGSAPCRG
jgi:hypothetical protein